MVKVRCPRRAKNLEGTAKQARRHASKAHKLAFPHNYNVKSHLEPTRRIWLSF